MEDRNNNSDSWHQSITKFFRSFKRRLKLDKFLFFLDTKKGVTISAITIIAVDLIDLLWNLSMNFGPLNTTLTSFLVLETFLVVFISCALLYAIKSENKSDLRSILLLWLLVVAIDFILRASLLFSSLIHSEKASASDKFTRAVVSTLMLALVAHCWSCVFTYYDDNNGKITTVKITPSDDNGRTLLGKRPMNIMKKASSANLQELNASKLNREQPTTLATNMLQAPTEEGQNSRW